LQRNNRLTAESKLLQDKIQLANIPEQTPTDYTAVFCSGRTQGIL